MTEMVFGFALLKFSMTPSTVVRMTSKSAGNSDAMNNLGVLLKDENSDAAQAWWQRAANAGHSGAMYNLGALLKAKLDNKNAQS